MGFGLVARGHNNLIGINSDWGGLVFIGKATYTGTAFFPNDQASYQWFRNFGPFNASVSEGGIAGTGNRQFYVRAETTSCGYYVSDLPIPDDNGYFNYNIDSPDYPHIFCYTSDSTICAGILSVSNTGTTGANGWPKWLVKVSVNYPTGMRATALSAITLYCFSKVYNTSPAHGLKVMDSLGAVVFTSDLKPIKIQDMVTINSTTMTTANDLSTLVMNDSTMSTPVTPLLSIPKPAFMNIDWARYSQANSRYLGVLNRFVVPPGACLYLADPTINYTQTFLVIGMRLNATRTGKLYALVGLDATGGSITNGAVTSTTVTKYEQLPVTIPVINGADYD